MDRLTQTEHNQKVMGKMQESIKCNEASGWKIVTKTISMGSAANTPLNRLDLIQYQVAPEPPPPAVQVELDRELSIIHLQEQNEDHPPQNIIKPCWEKLRKQARTKPTSTSVQCYNTPHQVGAVMRQKVVF